MRTGGEMPLTILDGGMGHELTRRLQTRGGLWSAQALLDAPEVVAAVHRDYLAAGARVITTNTYSTIPSYLAKAGLDADYLKYAQQAGIIARKVADEFPQPVKVMGSIPPLDESFRFDLVPSDDSARAIYEPLVATLAPYVDGFLCETMSCVRESVNAAGAVRACDKTVPLWISWTLAETPGQGLRSGESIAAAVAATAPLDVQALLFNCTSPAAISAALPLLRDLTDNAIGCYPNRLVIPENWTLDNDVATGTREMSAAEFVAYARQWYQAGASIIGGCCGIGPELITALSREGIV